MSKHIEEYLIPDVLESLKNIEASLGKASARPGEVSFAQKDLQPPAQFYVTHGMQLRLRSATSQTNETLSVVAMLLIEGQLMPLTTSSPAFSTTDTTTFRITTTGFLVSASVTAAVATYRGQTYCTLEVLDQTGNFLFTLFSGYVLIAKPLAYPPIFIEDPVSGNGFARKELGAIFAPGFYATWYVPVNRAWKIIGVNAVISTSAVAGNRSPHFTFGDPGGSYLFFPGMLQQAASLAWRWIWGQAITEINLTASATVPMLSAPFSTLILGEGSFARIIIGDSQAGDSFFAAATTIGLIEEYVTL